MNLVLLISFVKIAIFLWGINLSYSGAGMVIRMDGSGWREQGWSLNKATSIFTAEGYAILQAVKLGIEALKDRRFIIATDPK